MTPKKLSDVQIGGIIELHRSTEYSNRRIADMTMVGRRQVDCVVSKYKNGQPLGRPQPGSGRPRRTTAREDRLLIRAILKDREITIHQIKVTINREDLSDDTIARRISELTNMKSYWKVLKPFVNEFQRHRRVNWCLAHRNWTVQQWRAVIWSDESPFTLSYNRRTRV